VSISFDERFEVLRELGSGEFADVSEVRDRDSGALFALKRSRDGASLKNEFAMTRAAAHAGVVCVHELGVHNGASAFTMELLVGDDLITHVRKDLVLPAPGGPHLPMAFGQPLQAVGSSLFRRCSDEGLRRLRSSLAMLTEVLAHVHQLGMVHRDLQPANVRVASDGGLTLIDFGLTARQGATTATPSLGAPSHIAPEDAAGVAAHVESDWYAIGVLLFEALTGELPFAGTGQDVLLRKQTVSAPAPSFFVDNIPRDLDALCRGLLQPSQNLRFGAPQLFECLTLQTVTGRP
jgi:serine/threonine protein kinase